jgi:hypothetical protein
MTSGDSLNLSVKAIGEYPRFLGKKGEMKDRNLLPKIQENPVSIMKDDASCCLRGVGGAKSL